MNNLWRITLDTNPEDCNYSCIMCEEHSPYSHFRETLFQQSGTHRRVMPEPWLDSIFEECHRLGVKEIIPSTMGEPLLYKHFDKIVSLCKQFGIRINLTTNGSFPRKTKEEWIETIVPIASDIKFSLNGSTPKTSESIMLKSHWERQITNIKKTTLFRDEFYEKSGIYCNVTIQLTFLRNNMHELEEIIELASNLGIDRIKGHHLWVHFDEINHLSFRKDKSSRMKWNQLLQSVFQESKVFKNRKGNPIRFENFYPLPVEEDESKSIPDSWECPFLAKELWISAEGKISPCCAPDDLRKSLGDFGNIREQTLSEVLHSKEYTDLTHNYKNYPLCKTCVMRKKPQ
ncbi:MAG: radical SAM protein [Leptospiraceae bacterium]|nr:radical SAM protein [Leptospiraceae bacterium]MCP5513721.1 radical SAM protein [Leptospiraceae bacterium]